MEAAGRKKVKKKTTGKKKARKATTDKKRPRLVKYCRLDKYLGDPLKWKHFTDPVTGEKVYRKKALVTLKTAGRTLVYAFKRESCKKTKFIMTNPALNNKPDHRNIYQDYRIRWRIEEAHRDLKQQFGLGKCRNRDAWAVNGFIGLIYFAYSLFKQQAFFDAPGSSTVYNTPTWAEEFHKTCVYLEMAAKIC